MQLMVSSLFTTHSDLPTYTYNTIYFSTYSTNDIDSLGFISNIINHPILIYIPFTLTMFDPEKTQSKKVIGEGINFWYPKHSHTP